MVLRHCFKQMAGGKRNSLTATYNKLQYRVGGIIKLIRGGEHAGASKDMAGDLVIFGVPIEAAGSKSCKRMCRQYKVGRRKEEKTSQMSARRKHFYCFLVNILKKKELELKLINLHTLYGTATRQ